MKKLDTLIACLALAPTLPALATVAVTRQNWTLTPAQSSVTYSTESSCLAAVPQVDGIYHCVKDTTSTVTGTAAAPAPPPAGSGSALGFSSDFGATERPISEGGVWRRANNVWTNVVTENGTAHGTNGVTNGYDDSYALLSGFGADQTVEAVVQRSANLAQGITHEVELLLRFSDDNGSARGYECLFNYQGGYEIVRWNGPYGSYTPLSMSNTVYFGRQLQTGDVIKANIVGNLISIYINGTRVAQATDSSFTSGQPGIAFFTRPGGNSANLALTSVKVTSN